MLESWIREATLATSLVVEGISASIVAFAVFEAVLRLLLSIHRHSGSGPAHEAHHVKEEIRLRLGRWLPLDGPPARERALAGRLAARAILFVTHIDKPSEPHRAETLKYTDAETSEHRHSLKKERNV